MKKLWFCILFALVLLIWDSSVFGCGEPIKEASLKIEGKSEKELIQYYCSRISQIRNIPFKMGKNNERASDPILKGILKLGEKAVPCLIENLSNLTLMPYPLCPTLRENTAVGDTSLFLLNRITKRRLKDVLPENVAKDMKKNGVYAYYDYVEKIENRQLIQANWRQWAKTHLN